MNVIENSIEVYKNMAKSATQDSINYKKRIDKAIEYVENKKEDINNGGNDMSYRQLEHLLKILKGSDKE